MIYSPKSNIAPESRPGQKRKRSYSNHPFAGAKMLVSGIVATILPIKPPFTTPTAAVSFFHPTRRVGESSSATQQLTFSFFWVQKKMKKNSIAVEVIPTVSLWFIGNQRMDTGKYLIRYIYIHMCVYVYRPYEICWMDEVFVWMTSRFEKQAFEMFPTLIHSGVREG